MKRSTLKLVLDELTELQRDLGDAPHRIAVKIEASAKSIAEIVIGEEFDGQDTMGQCESCEDIILTEDAFYSNDDGVMLCASCIAESDKVAPQPEPS